MADAHMPDHSIEFEPSPRRVRAVFNGEAVGDSTRMMLLRERKRIPVYYFPRQDVRMDLLDTSGQAGRNESKGEGVFWHVVSGGRRVENAAFSFRGPQEGAPDLSEFITFDWDSMDAWFEEDEEIFVHARDPYKRVDVLNSSRHVRVEIDGETVAETHRPRMLFETGMPTRYYIPRQDVRMDLLEKSESMTGCPYKGDARYYSVRVGDTLYQDLVWVYQFPVMACAKVEGLLCFFNEKVDLYEDGKLLPRPQTPWS